MVQYKYYKKYTGQSGSLVDALTAIGVKDVSLKARKKIATLNGIKSYSGTAAQNTALLKKLKAGKLIKSATNVFPHREKFLGRLQTYNPVLKEYGKKLYYSWDDAEPTFKKAKARLEDGKKTGLTCVVPCRWALKDIGIDPTGFYGDDGTFKYCYEGDIKKHMKRITSGDPIGKTAAQAVKGGMLVPGDILTYKGKTHTFTFSGEQCKMYDGGHSADYPKVGILVDYSARKEKISEVLRWED